MSILERKIKNNLKIKVMKNLLIKSWVFILCFLCLIILGVLNATPPKFNSKFEKAKVKQDDCREFLAEKNAELLDDEDGLLDDDELASYRKCVEDLRAELDEGGNDDWENNDVHTEMLMLDCYQNLMEYYDEAGNDAAAEYWEGEIDEITTDN